MSSGAAYLAARQPARGVAVQGFVHHQSSEPSVKEYAKVAIVLGHVRRLDHDVEKNLAALWNWSSNFKTLSLALQLLPTSILLFTP